MPEAERGLRLFVACELPEDVREALGRMQDELRKLDAGALRFARPDGIHVTLKFLGNVEEARVSEITAALGAAIEPFALHLRPATLGGFPAASPGAGDGARLRVVWVGLEGDVDALGALARRVEAALAPLEFPAERRPFAPHLTLARVRDTASARERRTLSEVVGGYGVPPMPSMMLTSVVLMRSVLGAGGSAYHRLASFPKTAGGELDGLG
ncbi:MAG: RNA 2',3'-cyclic phosphodiesterase [Dehalococcoidia bacterium]